MNRTTNTEHQPTARLRPMTIISVSLLLALGITAAACGSDDDATSATDPVTTTEPERTTTTLPASTTTQSDQADRADSPVQDGMAAILEAHLAEREFVGAVMALTGTEGETTVASSGAQDLTTDSAPVDPAVTWGIGSVTKTFIAVTVLQLVDDGLLDLDQTIESYFPDLPNNDQIAVRDLLQHTSGVNEYLDLPAIQDDAQRQWAPSEQIDLAIGRGALGEPGGPHAYSNTNYVLLGEIIEQVTSNPWDQEVRTRILEPLGMTNTGFAAPAGTGFGAEDGQFIDYSDRWHPSIGGAAGGMSSTVSDLVLYTNALADGTLLQEATRSEMTTWIPGDEMAPGVVHEYGLGFEQYTLGELTVNGHLGSGSAHSAFIGFDPETDASVVVMLNTEAAGPQAFIAVEALGALLDKDLGVGG